MIVPWRSSSARRGTHASVSRVRRQPVGAQAALKSTTAAQRLDVQQIKRLKAESASGDSVVIAIAQGSRTFASKSSFAQVKYLRKKARKHMQFVSALRPTALALSDMYAAKAPEKLLCLRRDSLALLLSLGGLQPARARLCSKVHSDY